MGTFQDITSGFYLSLTVNPKDPVETQYYPLGMLPWTSDTPCRPYTSTFPAGVEQGTHRGQW